MNEKLNYEECYRQFCTAKREEHRLDAAMNGLDEQKQMPGVQRQAYLEYLQFRKHSAVERAIELLDVSKLNALKTRGWIQKKYQGAYLKRARMKGNLEIIALLLGNRDEGKEITGQKFNLTETGGKIAVKAFAVVRKKLLLRFPSLELACGILCLKSDDSIERMGTDGQALYFREQWVLDCARIDFLLFLENYLHLLLHCLLLHPAGADGKEMRLWNLACDLEVKQVQTGMMGQPEAGSMEKPFAEGKTAAEIYVSLQKESMEADSLGERDVFEGRMKQLQQKVTKDVHHKWYQENTQKRDLSCSTGAGTKKGAGERLATIRRWEKASDEFALFDAASNKKAGLPSGNRIAQYTVPKQRTYDFGSFLRRFAVCGEEMEVDMDSFDYIPYWYSRNHYENVVLLEPLEYCEVWRLAELVIAIDTSGSCSGEAVRGFLAQTWQIFNEKENFFTHMNVFLIQCDSMIQSVVRITKEEEWMDYMKHVKVQGLGGTDFRPVFQLVNQKIEQGELGNLKGLLYFTDGDGIYPDQKPAYDTAFVFLNDRLKKQEIPKWAIGLNLNLPWAGGEEDEY